MGRYGGDSENEKQQGNSDGNGKEVHNGQDTALHQPSVHRPYRPPSLHHSIHIASWYLFNVLSFIYLQDLKLFMKLPHIHLTHQGHTDDYTRHSTALLDETNRATELGESVVTSRGTLDISDVTTMAPPFSSLSSGYFIRRDFLFTMVPCPCSYHFIC